MLKPRNAIKPKSADPVPLLDGGTRNKHIWFRGLGRWKCCLCGATTTTEPPKVEPADWMPEEYEALTDEDRARAPFVLGATRLK